MMRIFLVLFAFAIQGGHCQETEGTTLLGRVFGGIFSGGILSLLTTPDLGDGLVAGAYEELTGQNVPTEQASEITSETPENIQFLACTQSTACYNDSTQTPGAWTCRPQVVGDMSICVPTLLGITLGREGDTCGCCEGNCPKKCKCGCTTTNGLDGYMAHFNLFFGLVQFERCLEPTMADAATSFTTLDISCSEVCNNQGDGDEGLSLGYVEISRSGNPDNYGQ